MVNEELKKACESLKDNGFDFAIISSHENIAYVSGFDLPVSIGASVDFCRGLPLAIVVLNVREQSGNLVVADTYAGLAKIQNKLGKFLTFPTFGHFSPIDPTSSFLDTIKSSLNTLGLGKSTLAKVGIEFETLPAALLELLKKEFPNSSVSSSRSAFERARRIKTNKEIEILRHCAHVADAGQQVFAFAAKNFVEMSEFELWCKVEQEILKEAGKPVPVPIVGEIVTGVRTAVVSYPNGPGPNIINRGDMGIMDISIRIDGYWADCCNTVVFGNEPSVEQKKYFKAARDGFEAAVDSLRPGVSCSDIESSVRRAFEKNGFPVTHYSGHQIGATVNETPRIVPYDKSIVEAGMVFCFEPGVYAGPGGKVGARLERMVLVTEHGSEVLNKFSWGIEY